MIRKQIYLEKRHEKELATLSALTGNNVSALIRQAIDQFVEEQAKITRDKKAHVKKVLQEVAGMWADRDDAEFEEIRSEMNTPRKFERWND